MTDIPIELFSIFIGVSVVILGIGLVKRTGMVILISGLLILTLSVLTDTIILGKVPESSTVSGSTTTYIMVNNTFEFTQWHKILFAFIGGIIMMLGVVIRPE